MKDLSTHKQVVLPAGTAWDAAALNDVNFKYVYIAKDGHELILSTYEDPGLRRDYIQRFNLDFLTNALASMAAGDLDKRRTLQPDFTPSGLKAKALVAEPVKE